MFWKKTGASSVGAEVQVQAAGSSIIPVTTYINTERLNSENGLFKWHFFHTYELFHSASNNNVLFLKNINLGIKN